MVNMLLMYIKFNLIVIKAQLILHHTYFSIKYLQKKI